MSSRKPALVLVVEDDLTTRRMIEHIMARAGFRTACAGSVAEALAAIDDRSPDLILLDVGLPDGSGLDVCRRVHAGQRTHSTPVLFISSREDATTKLEGFEAGAVDYVTKPISQAELVARVRTHVRLRRAYEALAELQAERIKRLTQMQDSLMPKPSDFPEARFQVDIEQIEQAGGDFYDVIPTGTQSFDYLVADISGHDLGSSCWTSALKTVVTEYAAPETSPLQVVEAMNRVFCRVLPYGVHLTALYARLDRQGRKLSIVNAGHPPAILLSNGQAPVLLEGHGDVVGGFSDAVFDLQDLSVKPGDRFFLYSDGLIEVGGGREEGIRRLMEACAQRSQEPLSTAVPALKRDLTEGLRVLDDVVLLGVEV